MAPQRAFWGRYVEMRPERLNAIRAVAPVAYMSWGAITWHGPHLPLGADGIAAEAVAEQAVQRTGGVLLPTTWWPARQSLQKDILAIRSSVLRELWSDLFDNLATHGWKVVVVVNGHVYPEHELILIEAAEQAMNRHRLLILAVPPLAMLDENLIDHAALWESSILLSLCPSLVDLYALGEDALALERSGVRGRDPRGAASPSLGDTVLRMAVERLVNAVEDLMHKDDTGALQAFYAKRRDYLLQRQGQEQP